MGARFRSWWQQIKKHRVAIGVVAMVLVVAITLIIVGYGFDWTGFNGYNKVTVAHTISGTNAGTVIRTEEYQPGRTLWDWMQLLFIPVVLAVAGFWFNHRERRAAELRAERERKAAESRAEAERYIAEDNQREVALQAYINEMSALLLHANLRDSKPEDEVRTIARVLTLTVVRRCDAERKGSVLLFLHESSLIDKDKRIIDLSGADLDGANLGFANLYGANLGKADLSGANLSEANLSKADLSGANLFGADLGGANLGKADLLGASLGGADLSEADLGGTNLLGAKLNRANLDGAKLNRANLSEANLSVAYLGRADLSGANLQGADLSGANLEEAIVTIEQLNTAKSLKGATMPDGSIHP